MGSNPASRVLPSRRKLTGPMSTGLALTPAARASSSSSKTFELESENSWLGVNSGTR